MYLCSGIQYDARRQQDRDSEPHFQTFIKKSCPKICIYKNNVVSLQREIKALKNMERRIDYQKKLCNVCNDAMKSIVAMMKKRGIKVLDLKEKANECGIAYAHFYVDDEFVEDPITAVCLTSFESNMLFYTTELCIENELNVYDEEDVYNEKGEYDYEKLYDYDEVWQSFYDGDGDLADVIDLYDVVYDTLKAMEE